MKDLKPVIIVEGKSDVQFLESFLDFHFVSVNGSAISRETIEYIKELGKTHQLIVLTDPDAPGMRIRKMLNEQIPNLYHAYLPKDKCMARGKVGVAESDKETVQESLKHLVPNSSCSSTSKLTIDCLYELHLIGHKDSQKLRDHISRKLHLGKTNGKSFLKRCHNLNLEKEDLERALYE